MFADSRSGGREAWTPSDQLVEELFEPHFTLPDEVFEKFPSHLHIYTLVRAREQGNEARLLAAVMQQLSEQHSHGVHVELPCTNLRAIELYQRMGFRTIPLPDGMYRGGGG